MKRLVIALLLIACVMPVVAQGQRRAYRNGGKQEFSERFFEAKVNTVVSAMQLSDEKKDAFVPIYRDYSVEIIEAWNELEPQTGDDAEQLKAEMLRQEKTQAIRVKYTDRFLKVFTPGEVRKFFKIENEIQRRVKARKQAGSARRPGNSSRN